MSCNEELYWPELKLCILNDRGGGGNTNRQGKQLYELDDEDDEMGKTLPTEVTHKFFNDVTPWCPPPYPNDDDSIFHETTEMAEALMARSFTRTL
jgi:hypothetical protein